jgi:hypothetical protein
MHARSLCLHAPAVSFPLPPLQDDGPTTTLLEYMEKFDFQAPADWSGYRSLDSK